VDTTKPLTVEEIRTGVAAAIECRRVMVRHAYQLGGFMGGLGLLLVWIGYIAQGQVSPWAFLLPAALSAIVLPGPLRQVKRLSRLVGEFEAAERKISSGGVVRGQDIPSIGSLPAA
jgi:hypothetical protein